MEMFFKTDPILGQSYYTNELEVLKPVNRSERRGKKNRKFNNRDTWPRK